MTFQTTQLISSQLYQAGVRFFHQHAQELEAEVVGVCEVPAPPFSEQRRAQYVAERLCAASGSYVEVDKCGNVVCIYHKPAPGQGSLLVTAHLDTVFPPETNVQVKREGSRLFAPGVQDNSVSLAVMIQLVRFLRLQNFHPEHGLAFIADVGEEGLGDLRGMKYVFQDGLATQWDVSGVLVLDGALGAFCQQGIASRRLEVTYNGPGGHSWGDFGQPSAVHAAGRAIAAIDAIPIPEQPRTTCNVGVVEGGVSVNVIAPSARLVIDMRSEDRKVVEGLEEQIRKAITDEVEGTQLTVKIAVVGDRPGGSIPEDHGFLAAAIDMAKAHSLQPRLIAASTDANVPLSLGIPAFATGVSNGGRVHSREEYLEIESLVPGACSTLGLLLSCSGWLTQTMAASDDSRL